jgi:hypothetical protein
MVGVHLYGLIDTWGTERSTSNVILDPGLWSLDNFGQILVATIHNGKTFTWDAGAAGAREIRATVMTGAPTASRLTQVSDRDRHVFHFGTETTIGDPSTQDPMFIRFSNQEDFNTYAPTATNTAGTFRVDKGNEIVGAVSGKDYTLVLTDSSAYVIQFVGPPFTFSVKQVGTNCGLIGQNALSYSNGVVFWMSGEGGFFMYDGTVKAIPCLVEDFVFTTTGDNLGINYDAGQIVYAEHNTLYNEINWFYAKNGSEQIDRCVTFNYAENCWTTSSLARTIMKMQVYLIYHMQLNIIKRLYLIFQYKELLLNMEHQLIMLMKPEPIKSIHQVQLLLMHYIQSGDFDISARMGITGQTTGLADLEEMVNLLCL